MKAKRKPAKAKKADPIFAAIEQREKLQKIWCDLCHKLDLAEYKASKTYGGRPDSDERAAKAWDRRVGIAAQRRECDRAIEAEHRAGVRFARTKPTTPAGAGAMLAYLHTDVKGGAIDWHPIAFATIIATLKSWGKATETDIRIANRLLGLGLL
jgi:DnaJ-domain-containing protein 1